jgi:hypothetical protein
MRLQCGLFVARLWNEAAGLIFAFYSRVMRARITREGSHEKPATAGLSCREFVSEVKSRSLQEGFMCKSGVSLGRSRLNRGQGSRFPHTLASTLRGAGLLRVWRNIKGFALEMISIKGARILTIKQ